MHNFEIFEGKTYTKLDDEPGKEHPHGRYQNTSLNEFLIVQNPNSAFYQNNLGYQRLVHQKISEQNESNYPHIVKILKIEQRQEGDQILMEKGQENLEKFLQRPQISIRAKLACMHGAALAIQQIHSLDIIHRDIKASNFVVFLEGDHYIIKIIDFDISFLVDSNYVLDTQGTTNYKAPELFQSQDQINSIPRVAYEKIDIWAFGILLYKTFISSEKLGNDQEQINNKVEESIKAYEKTVYEKTFASIISLIEAILRVDYNERRSIKYIKNSIENILDTYPVQINNRSDLLYCLIKKEGIFYDVHGNAFDLQFGNPYQVNENDQYRNMEKLKTQLSARSHIINNKNIKYVLEVLINIITIRYSEINNDHRQLQLTEESEEYLSKFHSDHFVEQIQHNLVYHYLNNNPTLIDLIQMKWNFTDKFHVFMDKLVLFYSSKLPGFEETTLLLREQGKLVYYSGIVDLPFGFNCKRLLPNNGTDRQKATNIPLIKYYLPDNIKILEHETTPTIYEILWITLTLIYVAQYLDKNQLMFSFEESEKLQPYKEYVIKYETIDGKNGLACTYRFIRKKQDTDEEKTIKDIIGLMKQCADKCPGSQESEYKNFYLMPQNSFRQCKQELQDLIRLLRIENSQFNYPSLSQSNPESSNSSINSEQSVNQKQQPQQEIIPPSCKSNDQLHMQSNITAQRGQITQIDDSLSLVSNASIHIQVDIERIKIKKLQLIKENKENSEEHAKLKQVSKDKITLYEELIKIELEGEKIKGRCKQLEQQLQQQSLEQQKLYQTIVEKGQRIIQLDIEIKNLKDNWLKRTKIQDKLDVRQ